MRCAAQFPLRYEDWTAREASWNKQRSSFISCTGPGMNSPELVAHDCTVRYFQLLFFLFCLCSLWLLPTARKMPANEILWFWNPGKAAWWLQHVATAAATRFMYEGYWMTSIPSAACDSAPPHRWLVKTTCISMGAVCCHVRMLAFSFSLLSFSFLRSLSLSFLLSWRIAW